MSVVIQSSPFNARCILLDNEGNERLFSLLGNKCMTLASAVVQLYVPDQNQWKKHCYGVACFVKDSSRRSFFIRLYDIQKGQMLWETELNTQFRYKTPRDFFHTFETITCEAGLNFASEDEASMFQYAVESKLAERARRRMERSQKRKANAVDDSSKCPHTEGPPQTRTPSGPIPVTATENVVRGLKNKKTKKDKKVKLKRDDISSPINFIHVNHLDWNPHMGFKLDKVKPEMKMLFDMFDINPDDPEDKERVIFIYDFVEKNGGLDVVGRGIERSISRLPSQRRPLAPPEPYAVGNQPPTPTIMPPKTQTPSNLPQGNQGPPLRVPAVPTPRRRDPPPLPVDLKSALAQQSGGSPLPPPPPHKSSGSPSPQSGSLPSPQQPDGPPPFQQSSGLPPQQSGGPPPSKIATSDDQPAKSTHGHLDSDSRGNLFNDIVRIGQGNLKRVETPDEKPASKTDSDCIIDLLIKEMEKRDRFIHGLDDYDDYEASEWEC